MKTRRGSEMGGVVNDARGGRADCSGPDVPGTRPCRVDAAFAVTCYLYNYSETPALAARSRLLIMRPKKGCLELSSLNQWWLCPKKGVWNFQALKTPAFIEAREFQTPFFGQSMSVVSAVSVVSVMSVSVTSQ